MKEKSYKELFLELAQPDQNGVSRWVDISEFVEDYEKLKLGNGSTWLRRSSSLAKEFNIENDKSITSGNRIDRVRLNGFNTSHTKNISQAIRSDIKKAISSQRCAVLGTNRSCDHKVEVDHKDGRKDDLRVMNVETQKLEDFQPLSKPANDTKREFCKKCKESGIRFDAKTLGYSVSTTVGTLNYDNHIGCIGCFWFDPVAFRQKLTLNS